MRVGSRGRSHRALQLAVVGVLAAGAWVYATRLVVFPPWHHTFDLRVYRGAVQWWLHGHPLYEFVRPGTSKGFTYPPFAAVALLPLAWGTETTATVLLTTGSAVLVVLTTWLLLAPIAHRHGWSPWFTTAVAVPLVVVMEPVRETLGWGQLNLYLVALVLADVVGLRHRRGWAGVGTGLAAAVKLTPALFVIYLLVSRRWRAFGVATGTFLAASLLGFALRPHDSVRFWTVSLWDTGRVGDATRTSNQSVLGLLDRLAAPAAADPPVWAVLVAVVLLVGLWRAARVAARGDELAGVTITGLTADLVSPISWTHHLYWVVPAVVVLLDVAAGTPLHPDAPARLRASPRGLRVAAGVGAVLVVAVFASSTVWYFDFGTVGHRIGGAVTFLGQNAYLLVMAALIAVLPARDPALFPISAVSGSGGPGAGRTTAPPPPGGSSPR